MGTVESQVNVGDLLKGYRGALYMGVGLAGLGLCLSLLFTYLRWPLWGEQAAYISYDNTISSEGINIEQWQ